MSFDYDTIRAALYREARLLDDRQWDAWLGCYAEDAVYWMPAWDDDDQPTADPQREISLMYYPDRSGLEDRVFRIKTERSGASTPEPRTACSGSKPNAAVRRRPSLARATTSRTSRCSHNGEKRWTCGTTSTRLATAIG